MQYLSPSTFTGEATFAPLDKKAIQLARKKLFADLELSGETTIELNGAPFSKNDIIQYFEDLLKEEVLTYHNAIGQDKVLLRFLENAQIGRKERFQSNPLYENEQFINWVSPYFYTAFTTFMHACFAKPDEDALISVLVNPFLMTGKDIEQGWDVVVRIITDGMATLARFTEQVKAGNAVGGELFSEVEDLMEFNYTRLFQLLPQSRFASVRNDYATSMIGACIATFNNLTRYRNNVKTWLQNAELLAVGEDMKAAIAKKLREMEFIEEPVQARKEGSSSSASALSIIGVVVFFIIRLATCNSHSHSNNYNLDYQNNSPYRYTVDSSVLKILRSAGDTSKNADSLKRAFIEKLRHTIDSVKSLDSAKREHPWRQY